MTAQEARKQLPAVNVRIGNAVLPARVGGSDLDFAQVYVKVSVYGAILEIHNEWSWSAIAQAATTGKSLIW
jgi:hypothetical protein